MNQHSATLTASSEYTVEKLAPGRWRVARIDTRTAVGFKIGTVGTRKQALGIARLLAGWRGVVHIT
jgi:hypothetical protein